MSYITIYNSIILEIKVILLLQHETQLKM